MNDAGDGLATVGGPLQPLEDFFLLDAVNVGSHVATPGGQG